MQAPWLVRVAFTRHPLLVPGAIFLVGFGYLALTIELTGGTSWAWRKPIEAWSSALVYSLIPAYLLFCAPFEWRRSEQALTALSNLLPDAARAQQRVLAVPWRLVLTGAALGLVYGVIQYAQSFERLRESQNLWLDLSMMGGNAVLWLTAGGILAWRLHAGAGFRQLGSDTQVDLYDQEPLRPFVRVAMLDVLVVMGAVAIMPLQSLDADFRWNNYRAGLLVSVPAALLFVLLPLWGVHQALRAQRQERLAELKASINRCDRRDIVRLAALVEHRHRVATMSTWPFDLRLLSRTLLYLVIPPLTWVGAALVEHLIF